VFAGDWAGVVHVWQVSDGKVLGELSPNPPRIADRLEAATKKLTESQPAIEKAEADFKSLKEAAEKADADAKAAGETVGKAKQTLGEAEFKLKAADDTLTAKAKEAGPGVLEIIQKRRDVDNLQKELESAEQAAAAAKEAARAAAAAKPTAAGDPKTLEADLNEKTASVEEARKALTAAESAMKGKPDDQTLKNTYAEAKL